MRALLLLLCACTTTIDALPDPPAPPDPFDVLDQSERSGPPRYTSRVHGCTKLRYATLGRVLASRGVDLAATDATSAGKIYSDGAQALGAANLGARVRENIDVGLATTAKAFEVWIQAAPEIIANQAARPECAGAPVIDDNGHCNARGISCLIGVPATPDHVAICEQTIARAQTPDEGRRLAVAVIAAAAHTCE